jgi:hypothetical protein
MSEANWNCAVGSMTTSSSGTIAIVIGGPGTISLHAYTPPPIASANATETIAMTLRTL